MRQKKAEALQQLQQDVSDLAKENQSLIGRLRSSVALVRSLLKELAKSLWVSCWKRGMNVGCSDLKEQGLVRLKKTYEDLL